MVKYKRIFIKNGEVIFEYYPEGDMSVPGVIRFNSNGELIQIVESEKDFKKYYALHAANGIDITKESGTVAWY